MHVININLKVKSKIVTMYVTLRVVRGMEETLKEILLTSGPRSVSTETQAFREEAQCLNMRQIRDIISLVQTC